MCGLFVDEISTIVWLKECDFHDYDVILKRNNEKSEFFIIIYLCSLYEIIILGLYNMDLWF